MGKLSTHVLDTAHGKPARGMALRLFHVEPTHQGAAVLVKSVTTNADGRTDDVLLSAAEMKVGKYAIEFEVGAYFKGLGHADAGKFLDRVRVDFVISDASAGYHVPLLVSPWAYSTYRGS